MPTKKKTKKAKVAKVTPVHTRRARKNRGPKLKPVNVKLGPEDWKVLTAKAKEHAKGNLSAWIRHAGKVHTPRNGEKVSLKAA